MAIEVDLGCNVLAVEQFIELDDTPSSYAGQAGKYPKVNGTEDGLEFGDAVDGVQTVTGDGVGGTAEDVVMAFPDADEVDDSATTNKFTDAAAISKLAGIEALAEVNTVDSVNAKTGVVVVDKTDVGLGNCDNTSDANKPVSTATQTALDGKRPNISISEETADFSPSAEVDNTYIDVNKATDVTITFNTGAFDKDGDVVYFQRVSAGRILFSNGTASITAAPSLSLVSGGIGSIQAVVRKSASVYLLTGTTE